MKDDLKWAVYAYNDDRISFNYERKYLIATFLDRQSAEEFLSICTKANLFTYSIEPFAGKINSDEKLLAEFIRNEVVRIYHTISRTGNLISGKERAYFVVTYNGKSFIVSVEALK